MAIVHKVALSNLVVGHLHTTTQLWQYHHLDIFIRILIPEVLAYQHDRMTAPGGVSEEVDVVADRFGGVAVMADAVVLARGVDVEAGGIDGRCRSSYP